jgi:uncharacterized membrane protein required for colicin V production
MNWLDYVILGIIAIFVYRGFRKGFLSRVLGLAGVVAGIWLGVRYNFKVAQFLKDFGVSAEIAPYFAMFLIFCHLYIGCDFDCEIFEECFCFR